LYCLARIAAASSGTVEAPLIGSLMQAIVAAAVEHREHDEFRRSIFFAVKGDVMECACYAGYEGQQDAGRSIFSNSPDDSVGQYMFRLPGEREASLIRDVDAADLTVGFPHRRSYQTIIAAAVMAGESPAGILTLDAPQPDSLGQPDLEIMKTLASLLGVGWRWARTPICQDFRSRPRATVNYLRRQYDDGYDATCTGRNGRVSGHHRARAGRDGR
jgi:hypothetical protein